MKHLLGILIIGMCLSGCAVTKHTANLAVNGENAKEKAIGVAMLPVAIVGDIVIGAMEFVGDVSLNDMGTAASMTAAEMDKQSPKQPIPKIVAVPDQTKDNHQEPQYRQQRSEQKIKDISPQKRTLIDYCYSCLQEVRDYVNHTMPNAIAAAKDHNRKEMIRLGGQSAIDCATRHCAALVKDIQNATFESQLPSKDYIRSTTLGWKKQLDYEIK